jgi:transcriptional regulator with XRE-family HTH domain
MKNQHDAMMEDPELRKLLFVEALVAEASEAIARLMVEQNVSKADLARRLNKSRAWVTQLLGGKANMTIRTLADVVYALDAEITLHAQSPGRKRSGKPLSTPKRSSGVKERRTGSGNQSPVWRRPSRRELPTGAKSRRRRKQRGVSV